jgi:hypothetical protein
MRPASAPLHYALAPRFTRQRAAAQLRRYAAKQLYLVNWHDTDKSNFVTLVIDLARKKLYSSALLYYGSQNEVESFSEATINRAGANIDLG